MVDSQCTVVTAAFAFAVFFWCSLSRLWGRFCALPRVHVALVELGRCGCVAPAAGDEISLLLPTAAPDGWRANFQIAIYITDS
eukprot:6207401-Pleurochrysis_carterae.AAC.7